MANSKRKTSAAKARRSNRATSKVAPLPVKAPRSGTKLASLIALLRRPAGASITDAVKATGWQPHTIRGAISGMLRKKLGLAVVSARSEQGVRVYKIAA